MYYKIGRLIRTIQYLTFEQLLFRIIYISRINKFLKCNITLENEEELHSFQIIQSKATYRQESNQFTFLNLSVTFEREIDWNYLNNGKLWTFNLCYLEFINQENISSDGVLKILKSFNTSYPSLKHGVEPYPTALRIINLAKILSKRKIDKFLVKIFKRDIVNLYNSLEYHLLGNHLLENGFALYFASHIYPKNEKLRNKAIKILRKELEKQILNDGAHFERSLMYHQIILSRLLECISLSKSNRHEWNSIFLDFLISKAEKMLGWLSSITERGQVFIRFNDSIEGISPTTFEILRFSKSLGLNSMSTSLTDSGFRKFKVNDLLMITNTGGIISNYQPGHSHANTFSFLLFDKTKPIIVDPGISTYENNRLRHQQRSTANHNTININGVNNNEVWSSFRVGRRAKVKIIQEHTDYLKALHNGYSHFNVLHSRSWKVEKKSIRILDELIGKSAIAEFNIHLHPEVKVQKISNYKVLLNDNLIIEVNSNVHLEISSYDYAVGFNRLKKSTKIHGQFHNKIETLITIV